MPQPIANCLLPAHAFHYNDNNHTRPLSRAIEHPPPEVKHDPAVGRGGGGRRRREHVHPHDPHGAAPVPNQAERRQVRDADAGAGEGHAAGEVDGLEVVQVDGDGAPVDAPDLVGLCECWSRQGRLVGGEGETWVCGWFVGRDGAMTVHDMCVCVRCSIGQ